MGTRNVTGPSGAGDPSPHISKPSQKSGSSWLGRLFRQQPSSDVPTIKPTPPPQAKKEQVTNKVTHQKETAEIKIPSLNVEANKKVLLKDVEELLGTVPITEKEKEFISIIAENNSHTEAFSEFLRSLKDVREKIVKEVEKGGDPFETYFNEINMRMPFLLGDLASIRFLNDNKEVPIFKRFVIRLSERTGVFANSQILSDSLNKSIYSRKHIFGSALKSSRESIPDEIVEKSKALPWENQAFIAQEYKEADRGISQSTRWTPEIGFPQANGNFFFMKGSFTVGFSGTETEFYEVTQPLDLSPLFPEVKEYPFPTIEKVMHFLSVYNDVTTLEEADQMCQLWIRHQELEENLKKLQNDPSAPQGELDRLEKEYQAAEGEMKKHAAHSIIGEMNGVNKAFQDNGLPFKAKELASIARQFRDELYLKTEKAILCVGHPEVLANPAFSSVVTNGIETMMQKIHSIAVEDLEKFLGTPLTDQQKTLLSTAFRQVEFLNYFNSLFSAVKDADKKNGEIKASQSSVNGDEEHNIKVVETKDDVNIWMHTTHILSEAQKKVASSIIDQLMDKFAEAF